MVKQTMIIIIQSLIAAFVLMWLVISYVLIEAVGISDIFTDFQLEWISKYYDTK